VPDASGPAEVRLDDVGGWPGVLATLTRGDDLDPARARAAMGEILAGEATPARIAAFIVALRMKGASVGEVTALVDAMLEAASAVPLDDDVRAAAVDIVGTGGASTRAKVVNVSTIASFVAAGAGATVCKHGNRRVSSSSGSFDLLEELGIPADLAGEQVARCVTEVGLGFCFARSFHPAMRHAAPVRAELGIPTVFNFLGPLSHPARVARQVIGVSDPATAPVVIGVLQARGAPRAMVVHGHDGMDELTTTDASTVHELRDGMVRTYVITPEEVGLARVAAEEVAGGDPAANAALARHVLTEGQGPHADLVVLNAAAGLVVAGLADDLVDGVRLARDAITQGRADEKLAALVALLAG
jgi:anthranilate phosphoribosyltransferase